jgi:hypothetical protein
MSAHRVRGAAAARRTPPLEVVANSHLTSTGFYVFAAPARRPAFVRAILGSVAPHLIARAGFRSDGIDFRVSVDAGFGPADHRAAVRSPGA